MSETVKLIIEIPVETYEYWKTHKDEYVLAEAIGKGVLLDSNSEKAEVQAYFDGQAYGWEGGRKDLCDKISAEIKDRIDTEPISSGEAIGMEMALDIVEKYKEDKDE